MTVRLERELGRCVFREANDAFFIIRPDDLHVCEVNPAAQRLTGLRRKQLLTMTLDDLVESAEISKIADLVRACQTTAYFVSAGGFSVKRRDGGKRAVHLSVSRIHTEPETLALLIVRDISRQKQTEDALSKSEARNRALLQAVPDLMFRVRGDGTFLDYRAAHGSQPAVPPEDFLGKKVVDVLPVDVGARIMEHITATLATGQSTAFEYPLPSLDGRLHHWEARFVVSGESEVIAIVRDITDRVLAQERAAHLLHQVISAQEAERGRLARELHDATGQSLTFLRIGLHTLVESDIPEAAKGRARELHRIVAQTLEEVQHLARALRPPVLDDLGLVPALERHVRDCRQLHGLAVTLRADGLSDRRLPPLIETALYRIAQEAITNVAKHAEASTIVVSLKRSGSALNFTIEDDGRGFDAERVLSSLDASWHLGLSTMRERAVPLGGTFTIDSKPGRGTRISVQLPIPHVKTHAGDAAQAS